MTGSFARRLSRRLKAEYGEGDPAQWHEVINTVYWGPYFGDPPEDYAARQKLSVRIVATMQRAVLSGQIVPSWFDGSNFREIPLLAFYNTGAFHNALLHGTFEIDPLWADEWQLWNGQGWAIESSSKLGLGLPKLCAWMGFRLIFLRHLHQKTSKFRRVSRLTLAVCHWQRRSHGLHSAWL